ncbi:MAG: hypothetical protein ACMG6H_15430, partial [Acidobacteriota bacterium]
VAPVVNANATVTVDESLPTAVPTMDPIRHEIRFKACTASVTVTYSWQVTINGTKSIIPRPPKRFACTKAKGRWLCRLSLN